jgi:hypothetical protein
MANVDLFGLPMRPGRNARAKRLSSSPIAAETIRGVGSGQCARRTRPVPNRPTSPGLCQFTGTSIGAVVEPHGRDVDRTGRGSQAGHHDWSAPSSLDRIGRGRIGDRREGHSCISGPPTTGVEPRLAANNNRETYEYLYTFIIYIWGRAPVIPISRLDRGPSERPTPVFKYEPFDGI